MRKDAHVTVLQIEYAGIPFLSAVDDPLFAAHRKVNGWSNDTIYKTDFPVGILGCAEQVS